MLDTIFYPKQFRIRNPIRQSLPKTSSDRIVYPKPFRIKNPIRQGFLKKPCRIENPIRIGRRMKSCGPGGVLTSCGGGEQKIFARTTIILLPRNQHRFANSFGRSGPHERINDVLTQTMIPTKLPIEL